MLRHLYLSLLVLGMACSAPPASEKTPKKKAPTPQKGPSIGDSLKGHKTTTHAVKPQTCDDLYGRIGRCLINTHEKIYNIPIAKAPAKGAADALVTVVEFSDMECPGCAYWALNIFPALLKQYPKEVKISWKHFPLSFHPIAPLASQALEEVRAQRGDAAFWKVHDHFYAAQKELSFDTIMLKLPKADGEANGASALKKLLLSLKINLKKYKKALLMETHKKKVEQDIAFGNSIGVNQTPQIFVNGRMLPNGMKLEDMVASELVRAKKLVAKGVAKGRIYSHIVGKGAPVLSLPLGKAKIASQLKKLKPLFVERCEKAPKLQPLVKIMKQCSQSHKECDPFKACVDKKMRALAP